MKTVGQIQALFENRDQHVSADRDPDLRLDGVLAGAQKRLDSQMLFYPFEEQLYLPSLPIKCGDHLGLERKVVGQESQAFATLVLGNHSANDLRIISRAVKDGEHPCLVADDLRVDPIDRVRVSALELGIGLGAGDEERLRLMNGVKPFVIEVAPIQQVIRTRLDHEIVQHVDLVCLAIRDSDKAWDGTPQIQERMQFDRALGLAKRCPGIHREAKIDGGRIEGVDRRIQIDAQRLVEVKRPGNCNQMLSVVRINLPRSCRIGIGQGVARQSRATKSHVIKPLGLRTEIYLDIAKRLSVCQLRKRHRKELIQTSKVFDLVVAPMGGDTASKSGQWQMHHDLRKNEFALVHESSSRNNANSPQSARNQS